MTKTAIAALRWFKVNGPVGWFDQDAPTRAMRVRLEKAGLIEKLPAAMLRVVKYQISAKGLADLEAVGG